MRQVELFVSFSKCSVFIISTSILILSFLSHSYHSSSDHNHYVQPLFSLNSFLKTSLSYHDNDHDGIKDHRLHHDSTGFSNDLFQNISMSGIYQLKTGKLLMRYSVMMMMMIMIMTILMILVMMKTKVMMMMMMMMVLIMMMLMLEIPNCYYAVKAPRSLGYAV